MPQRMLAVLLLLVYTNGAAGCTSTAYLPKEELIKPAKHRDEIASVRLVDGSEIYFGSGGGVYDPTSNVIEGRGRLNRRKPSTLRPDTLMIIDFDQVASLKVRRFGKRSTPSLIGGMALLLVGVLVVAALFSDPDFDFGGLPSSH